MLGALDCLVVPSFMRESYSLVTREALAAGVPVIASDSGGPSEIVRPERNGLLFATGDADDLAPCLRRFVLEPGLAETLREGAAATPIPTPRRQIDQLEGVYAELRSVPTVAASAATVDPQRTTLGPVLFLAGCDGAPFRYRVTPSPRRARDPRHREPRALVERSRRARGDRGGRRRRRLSRRR